LLDRFSDESEQLLIVFHSTCATSAAYNLNSRKFTGVKLSTRFNTRLKKYISCQKCKFISSSTFEDLNGMIQLDIKSSEGQHHSAMLENMLSNYCSAEQVEFTCRNCNSTTDQYQFSKTSILPSELILHIKRFSYNEFTRIHSKNMTPVIFPSVLSIANCKRFPFGCDINTTVQEEAEQDVDLSIDMYPDYGHSGLFAAPSCSFKHNLADFYEKVEDICSMTINTLQYKLTGVIRHKVMGYIFDDPNSGHYIADTCDESRESSSWKRCDDTTCTDTTLVLSYFNFNLIYIAYNILNICCL
jgi:hypothetical protein